VVNVLMLNTPTAMALDAKTIEYLWQTPLLGVGMVFLVLAILWGVLTIFKFIFAEAPAKKKSDMVEDAQPEAEAEEEIVEPIVYEQNDDELVAVITAAVAAYIASEDPDVASQGFRVVSFRRTNGGKPWNTK